ncbi:helix-turn-helix domain-containing protein [Streptomyces sp. NPDC059467]|uniref:helix-turn-helix domain-containing protein n=1 Tax=Streptomyces sp. NPDC059467 TaxID=3346844 RepID=UPI0036D19FE3
MSRFRMYPTPAQAEQMLLHCAHARYVWNCRAACVLEAGPRVRARFCGAVPSADRSPAGQRVAGRRERGRAAAGPEGLRHGQKRPLHLRLR